MNRENLYYEYHPGHEIVVTTSDKTNEISMYLYINFRWHQLVPKMSVKGGEKKAPPAGGSTTPPPSQSQSQVPAPPGPGPTQLASNFWKVMVTTQIRSHLKRMVNQVPGDLVIDEFKNGKANPTEVKSKEGKDNQESKKDAKSQPAHREQSAGKVDREPK